MQSKIVDHLDVTLNLLSNINFSKPNNKINQHTLGIQPPTVFNQTSTFFSRVMVIKSFFKLEKF